MELILIIAIVALAGAYCARSLFKAMKPRPTESSCGCGCNGCPVSRDHANPEDLPDSCKPFAASEWNRI